MKSRIEKTQFQIVELLIPTLNKGCRYQFLLALLLGKNHEQS